MACECLPSPPPLTEVIHLGSGFCHPLVFGGLSLHRHRVQLAQPAGNSDSGKSVSGLTPYLELAI